VRLIAVGTSFANFAKAALETKSAIEKFYATLPATALGSSATSPQDVPHAGITAGEIVGHRYWYVLDDGRLRSSFTSQMWLPGQVVSGDPNQGFICMSARLWGGVYALKNKRAVDQILDHHKNMRWPHAVPRRRPNESHSFWTEPLDLERGARYDQTIGLVVGTVQMWGEVHEHEMGWRAQHARILDLTAVVGMRKRINFKVLRQLHCYRKWK
jgi:hypothetical protein